MATYVEMINTICGQMGYGNISGITDTTSVPEVQTVVRVTNAVLQAMSGERPWPELRESALITITGPTTEASIANITKGSATLTLEATSTLTFSSGDVGKIVQIEGYNGHYTISAYVGAREVTLDRVWTGTTVALGTITVAVIDYALPANFGLMLSAEMRNLDTGTKLDEISPSEMAQRIRDNGTVLLKQEATAFTIYGINSSGYKSVHFDTIFSANCYLSYEYQKIHPTIVVGSGAVNGTVLFPDQYLLYIMDQVIAKLSRDLENSAMVAQQANDAMKEAMRAHSSPSSTKERTIMRPQALRHGHFRSR